MITHEELKEILHYNPDTGNFIWKRRASHRIKVGDIAGHERKSNGYIVIGIKGILYRAHRLAWLFMESKWPEGQIDHINSITNDNRWCNLREATPSQNKQNEGIRKDNISGYRGVSYYKRIKKWRARITANGKERWLGYYDNIEDAIKARKKAELKYFGEFIYVKSISSS